MHGQNGPHLGDSVVQKVRCVEAEPIRELAGLRQEQEGEAELGDDGNGSTAARLCCCCYDYCGGEEGQVGHGRRRKELGRATGKARARVRGPPECQLPLAPAHGGHAVAAS
jgi:hypothetical protein